MLPFLSKLRWRGGVEMLISKLLRDYRNGFDLMPDEPSEFVSSDSRRDAGLDENLIRRELSSAERSQQTARRKELYKALHPETSNGGDRRSDRQNGELKNERFTKATAAATGQSE